MRRRGHYLGTELDERWWRRYARDGFLARGLGDWWLDDEALCFHRRLTKTPLVIAFADVVGARRGSWHAGQWAGRNAIIKVAWRSEGAHLCSGFVLARDPDETAALMREIGSRARRAGAGEHDAEAA